MRCVQVDEKARKCSHTSARSAAHWLLPAPSFWRRRKQFQCCRILLVQIQDIAMFSLFARRGAERSAMPLMQAVRTSDSVCFNMYLLQDLQTRCCLSIVFCVWVSYPLRVTCGSSSLLPLQGHDARRAHSPEAIKLKARGMPATALARGLAATGCRSVLAWYDF